jgi:addiction module HigA family antidote
MTLYVIVMKSPITPGEILLEEYLIPMGISQNAMARAIGVAPRAINEIIHARRSITPGAFFRQSPEFWHGIQVECDFRALAKDLKKLTAHIQPASTIAQAS